MKSNLLLNKICLIQNEYKSLLALLLPKLKNSYAPEVLDEINLFWFRHMGEIQLYLKNWFSGENSYVFTADTHMGYDDNEHLPFLLMGDKLVFDDPLSKYSEIQREMPKGKASLLYRYILKNDSVSININTYSITMEDKLHILVSGFLYTLRNEIMHGSSISITKSSKTTLGTYAIDYFAYLLLYYLLGNS